MNLKYMKVSLFEINNQKKLFTIFYFYEMHLYCTYNIVNDSILHIRFYASTQINILTFAHINQLPMHTFKKLMNQNIFICLFISPNLIFLGHFYINKILCTYNCMLNLKLHLHIRLKLVCNIILKLQDFCLFFGCSWLCHL